MKPRRDWLTITLGSLFAGIALAIVVFCHVCGR